MNPRDEASASSLKTQDISPPAVWHKLTGRSSGILALLGFLGLLSSGSSSSIGTGSGGCVSSSSYEEKILSVLSPVTWDQQRW